MNRSVVCLFGMLAFAACSESTMPDGKGPEETGGRFLAVGIADPPGTRAGADDYETGSDRESAIGSLRFYFFDSEGAPVYANFAERKNFVDCSDLVPDEAGGSSIADNRLQAVVMVGSGSGRIASLAVVANYGAAGLGAEPLSLAELCAKVGDYAAAGADAAGSGEGFVMTSSSYAGLAGQICTTAVGPENLCETEADAVNNPVTVYLERIVAKARLRTVWNADKVTVVKGVTYNGRTYEAVGLKDSEGNAVSVGGKQVYALFTGWNITGQADRSYLFKKVNTEKAWSLGWSWNQPALFRSYWAVNPAGAVLGYVGYDQIGCEIGGTDAVYFSENAADNFADGTKRCYDPDSEVSNRTQAIIAAVLVTVDGGSVASPVDLARWAGADYTRESVKTAMLNAVVGRVYTKEGADFVPLKPGQVELVTGMQAGAADDKSENSARYLSYLQLTSEAAKLPFYSAAADDAVLTSEAVDGILREMPGARVWKDGMTYYYTDIRHLGSDEQKGLFGAVRNHVYEININSVVGLGTPVCDSAEKIVPQKPASDETYVAVKVNVLSWRTVGNDVDLVW